MFIITTALSASFMTLLSSFFNSFNACQSSLLKLVLFLLKLFKFCCFIKSLVESRNLFLLRGWYKLLLFLTRGTETLPHVYWDLSKFSQWENSVNLKGRVNSWMSLFSSMVLGFGVRVNFSPLLNKFIFLSVNGLDKRLFILGVTFTMSSRFDWGLEIKNVDPRW